MSSRSSSRRAAAATVPAPSSSRGTRSRLSVNVQATEPEEPDTEEEDDEDDDEAEGNSDRTPEPGAARSRRGVTRGKARRRGGAPARGERVSRERTRTGTADEADDGGKGRRVRKSVSYAEVPGVGEDEEMGDEDDGEEKDVEPERVVPDTPRRRAARAAEQGPASPSRREIERVGSGRGGFSVKGAAAAAARARWAKYRSEKAEESDDGAPRIKRGAGGISINKKDNRAAAERIAEGTVIEIKGKDYTVGDDEVILDEDEKGNLKVDGEGNLLGGREYRLVTFTSESRKNPKKVYALTIDAARVCGYQDSLAFLRRCPQILKLACSPDERQMLIDIGRVTGNLKNRMVTMVSMRNVYKLMGARVIKDGKWVTDDYYEDKAMTDCIDAGFTPFATVHEDEIFTNAMANMAPQGRPSMNPREDSGLPRAVLSLAPTYTLGGPTTHFAGGGVDPWSEAGYGNKRQKLKSLGVTEEDWIYRTALDSRMVDEQLREYRENRLGKLEGSDLKGWVWTLQKVADGEKVIGVEEKAESDEEQETIEGREPTAEWLKPPVPERKRSGLSQEVVPEIGDAVSDTVEVVQDTTDVAMMAESEEELSPKRKDGPGIIVQTKEEEARSRAKLAWSAGSWEPGVVRAVIEPHTHIPHVPLYTQPHSSRVIQLSRSPLIASLPDKTYQHHIQSSLSRQAARGLASVEFVFEPAVDQDSENDSRMRMVGEAEEWEREMRARKTPA